MIVLGNRYPLTMYSVWVGGVEINDYYIITNHTEALALAREYLLEGYDDVAVESIDISKCPACGDHMTYDHCNYVPTWSDDHDNVVCWWCATH